MDDECLVANGVVRQGCSGKSRYQPLEGCCNFKPREGRTYAVVDAASERDMTSICPADVEMISDGICETKPSPIVSSV